MKLTAPRIPASTDPALARELERFFRQVTDAVNANEIRHGPTSERPVGADLRPGRLYDDSDLGQLIRWNGSAWTAADGAAL